jgi:recombinational DNA repair ATPase RecF
MPSSVNQTQTSLEITLHNWRCFETAKFKLDTGNPLTIVDQNGTGKTSLLSAIYTLFTGLAWTGTTHKDNLMSNKDYFGISTPNPNWSFAGKINPSGRVSTKYENQNVWSSNPNYSQNPWNFPAQPKIITYIPTDNYWLSQTRTKKLSILDALLSQISLPYQNHKLELDRFLKSKQMLIKKCQENFQNYITQVNQTSLKILNQKIDLFSKILWAYRLVFLSFTQSRFQVYSGWLQNQHLEPIFTYQIATSKFMNRTKIQIPNFNQFTGSTFENIVSELKNQMQSNLVFENPNQEQIWHKEVLSGKILWGAQRDDFDILSNSRPVQNMLSRGETRLLILFLKNSAKELINHNTSQKTPIVWLLDDVFNELDSDRENFLLNQALNQSDWFLATSTKNSNLDVIQKNLNQLKI